MAVRLTKTSKIVFAIAIIALSVALGFLIWRVNEESRLDPTDSDAGATVPSGCSSSATVALSANCLDWYAEPGKAQACKDNRSNCCGNKVQNGCVRCQCCNGQWVVGSESTGCESLCSNNGGYGSCEDVPVVKCTCQSWSNGCGVNCKFPSDTQSKVDAKARGTCKEWIAMCNISDGSVSIEEYKPGHICYGKKDECKNPYAKDDCTPANVCDGGSWVTKPSGNIAYENDITFSAKAKDSDGIDKASISVKRGTTNIPICTTGQTVGCITLAETATETTISGTLSNASNRLQPGNYEITMSWKDKKGAASAACALSTTFTVLPQQTNPNWSITKGVVEQCIDAGTTNPKSELTYTITVKNTGNGAGTITKIEDVMDSKVQDSFVQTSSITSPGIYANKKITWTFSPALSIAAGATKTYTYKVVIDKDNFDTYANTVTLTPVGSSSIVATANITADCEIGEEPEQPGEEPEQPGEVPQTGIFDTTISRIIAGFALVFFGVLIYNAPNGIFIMQKKAPNYKYRENFEKKVANR